MRYKAGFQPTYILGKSSSHQDKSAPYSKTVDPENLQWNILDVEYRKMLDQHHYFSPSSSSGGSSSCMIIDSADVREEEAKQSIEDTTQESSHTELHPSNDTELKAPPEIDSKSLEIDSDGSSADDIDIPSGSLFDYHVPGILTKAQVEQELDLDHWKLVVRNTLIDMEDLNGWQDGEMTDPQSLKGIVAELAAVLGPEGVGECSAVDLF
jgi:hypothetical protein